MVPVAIRTRLAQSPDRYIKRLYLVVDRNPAPLAAVFNMTPESGRADIETRVRVEQYTDIRVVVEMNDDSLHMTSRYVKASGGCSAPAGKDPAAALAGIFGILLCVAVATQASAAAWATLAALWVAGSILFLVARRTR